MVSRISLGKLSRRASKCGSAGPQGSGGGYFIVKNSWGGQFGDGGYVYLPWDLVRVYTLSGMAVLD